MKTRNGFVSNSSSSSFVIVFPKKLYNVLELQGMLFGDAESFISTIDDKNWGATHVAHRIWELMEKQGDNNKRYACETLNKYDGDGAHDKEIGELVNDLLENEVFYAFEFGDNHGEITGSLGCALENTDVFDKFKNLKKNNH